MPIDVLTATSAVAIFADFAHIIWATSTRGIISDKKATPWFPLHYNSIRCRLLVHVSDVNDRGSCME